VWNSLYFLLANQFEKGMKISFQIISAFLLLYSCKKTGPDSGGFSGSFYSGKIDSLQPFRAFVSTGEIHDSAVLNRLMNYNAWAFSDTRMLMDGPPVDSIHFLSNNTGKVYCHPGIAFPSFDFLLAKNGNNIILTSTFVSGYGYVRSTQTQIDSLELFHPLLFSNERAAPGGYSKYDYRQQVFFTEVSPVMLVMPCFISIYVTRNTYYSDYFPPYNDEFNPNFPYQVIPIGDTVEVREISFQFHAK
jgi:hypothetical protein